MISASVSYPTSSRPTLPLGNKKRFPSSKIVTLDRWVGGNGLQLFGVRPNRPLVPKQRSNEPIAEVDLSFTI